MSTDPQTLDLPAADTAPAVKAPIAGAKPAVELLKYGERGVALSSLEDLFRLAKAIAQSGMAPKGYDRPETILVAVQMGAEVGLPPMAALQNIAVINGRPTLYGDAVPGICAGLVESYKDEMFGTIGSDDYGCRVTIMRKGRSDPIVRSFTIADAKKAGLWGKQGPWSQYPNRMMLMRARTYAYRDCFPDRMRGMLTAEEAVDIPAGEKNVTRSLDALDA
jgi:hypothetical protein